METALSNSDRNELGSGDSEAAVKWRGQSETGAKETLEERWRSGWNSHELERELNKSKKGSRSG